MAVLCHTHSQLNRIIRELTRLDVPLTHLAEWDGKPDDNVKIGTIHRAKGLEFAAVYVPDLSPSPTNPDTVGIEEEQRYTQREYVARTRARDHLWIGRIHAANRSRRKHTKSTRPAEA